MGCRAIQTEGDEDSLRTLGNLDQATRIIEPCSHQMRNLLPILSL